MSGFGRIVLSILSVFWFAFAGFASAKDNQVTLTLIDGSFSIEGKLVKFDSEYYSLESDLGLLTMAAATTRCLGDACPDPLELVPSVTISVSPDLGELLVPSLIESFASSRGYRLSAKAAEEGSVDIVLSSPGLLSPVANFKLTLMEATDGFGRLSDNSTDLAIFRRGPTLSEEEILSQKNPSVLRSQVIGWETLRLYANESSSLSALTVRDLFKKAKGEDEDGALEGFILDGDGDSLIALHQVLGQSVPVAFSERSRSSQNGVIMVTPNLALPPPLKHIPVSASCGAPIARDENSFGAQPLQAPIYMFHANVRLPKIARDFMHYTLSLPAQRIVSRSGYVSRTPSEARLESEQGILLNAVLNSGSDTALNDLKKTARILSGFGRLSLTFRYKGGTRELDDVSRSNLDYLASLLQQGRFINRDILFAGFSDSKGNAQSNLRLSQSRAEALRDTILSIMGENAPKQGKFTARGFGEVLPIACNDIAWGQRENRRVEIWVR